MFDITFLHPPVSFKKLTYPLSGLFESSTGTTDLLTMMPLGMLSLANEIHHDGFKTSMVNVAKLLQQIRDGASLNISEIISKHHAKIFGIDLHWAAHAAGALELAQLCKSIFPDSLVILGGLSSTYYAFDIIAKYPFIDGVIRMEFTGHSPTMVRELLKSPPQFKNIPNLVYRVGDTLQANEIKMADLSQVNYLDENGLIFPPAKSDNFEREALEVDIPVVRGCNQHCLFCGGNNTAYQKYFGRNQVELLPIPIVVNHIVRALNHGAISFKLFGDIRLGGKEYCQNLLREIKSLNKRLNIFLEFFWPATTDFLSEWREAASELIVTFSPESSHYDLRKLHKKSYDNNEILQQAKLYRDMDVIGWFCFIYLLPGHTPQSLFQELDLIEQILAIDPSAGIIFQPYLFVDPGSSIFSTPEQYEFNIDMHSLDEICAGIERAYWYFTIGYSTTHFSKMEFFRSILDINLRKAHLYFKHNHLSARDLLKTIKNIHCHGEIGKAIMNDPNISDSFLQKSIETIFPSSLRRSNSNLIVRPFIGGGKMELSPDALLFDAFPTTFELILHNSAIKINQVYQDVVNWLEKYQKQTDDFLVTQNLPEAVSNFFKSHHGLTPLPPSFIDELLKFEWDVFKLLFFSPPSVIGQQFGSNGVIKPASYDLIDINTLVREIIIDQSVPTPSKYYYLFDLKNNNIFCANFNPLDISGVVENAHIRQMSILERRFIRMEKTMLKIIAQVQHNQNPHHPRDICRGETLTISKLKLLLPSFIDAFEQPQIPR